jgi:hypothetical protein
MEVPLFFGNQEFGIQYRFDENGDPDKLMYCHLVIGNNLMGHPDEVCYLPTWYSAMRRNRVRIAQNKDLLNPTEFGNFSEREIFEMILKTNQLESEFLPDFLYLPHLSIDGYRNHMLHIDETIDRYLICYFIKSENLTFLIEDLTEVHGNGRGGKFSFHTVPLQHFLETVDLACNFLAERYDYLEET